MLNLSDNLGLATDLLLHAETGMVESQDDYVVVRTPDAPEYFLATCSSWSNDLREPI